MPRALDVPSVIAGEAVSGTPEERWADMVAIASVIANRARALGVTPQEVIANTNEFNAYNRAMPAGTPSLVDMAEEAMNYVEQNGPVTDATFYATPAAANNLPSGLNYETATTGHQYFSDPQQRAIGTALGYRAPNEFSWAANPENVPTPETAGLMAAAGEFGPSWTINGVVPAPMPLTESWTAMAAAQPVSAPMDVQAQGLLGTNPALSASATATPNSGLLASVDTSNFDMSRFGDIQPSTENFDQARFDAGSPQTVSIDPARFGNIPTASFDPARFAPSIDVATNTQSFTSPAPTDLGAFPGAMAAQRTHMGTGVYSPGHQQLQAQVDAQIAAARQQPSVSVPASGLLAANPALEASATVPSVQSSFAATPSITPAEAAINQNFALGMSPAQIGAYQQMAETALPGGITSLSGNTLVGPTGVATSNMPTPDMAPAQTEVATVEGPASTTIAPAVEQQQVQQTRQAVTQAAQPQQTTMASSLRSAINPGTAIGGLLGGVTLGPIGGLLGALAGNAINQNGLLGGAPTPSGGFLGYGPSAVAGVYGGAPAGSYAVASDGSRISSTGGGWTTRTDPNGVTTSNSPWGGHAGWFGGDPEDSEAA